MTVINDLKDFLISFFLRTAIIYSFCYSLFNKYAIFEFPKNKGFERHRLKILSLPRYLTKMASVKFYNLFKCIPHDVLKRSRIQTCNDCKNCNHKYKILYFLFIALHKQRRVVCLIAKSKIVKK